MIAGIRFLAGIAAAPRLLLLLLGCTLAVGGFAAKRDGAAAKESELKAMRERIETVRQSIQADAERRDALAGELKQADENIQTVRGSLGDIRVRRRAAEQQLADLEKERHATQQSIGDQRTELASELKLAYINGRGEQLKLMLNQQDPVQLGRMLNYYGYFGRARAEHIAYINDQLAHLELLVERIGQENDRLRGIEDENARNMKALAAARERRAGTLRQVESKLKDGATRLTKMQADAKSLERLIEELRRVMENAAKAKPNSAPPVGRGQWPWPVKGEVLARFGQLRSGGPLKWQGLMIGSEPGAQVRAPSNGRVVYADWLPGLGLLLILDHGGGLMSLYGHNEQLYRKVGDQVGVGEALAEVGDTGVDGHTGVYLEIRTGKQPVDPLNWLGRP